jgi:hypothetical protein
MEPTEEKKPDCFDIINTKQSYPKVKINVLGNLHQEKVIYVLQDEEQEQTQPTAENNELQTMEDQNIEIAAGT